MDAEKRPFFPALPHMRVAFCHSGNMSFCLLDKTGGAAAIDAEEENSGDLPAIRHFFNKLLRFPDDMMEEGKIDFLRLWLVYECAYKIFGENAIEKNFFYYSGAFNPPCANERHFYLDAFKLCFTFFHVCGCIVCAASTQCDAGYEIFLAPDMLIHGKYRDI